MTDELDDHIEKNKAFEERNRRRRNRDLADIKKVLSTVEGRRLFWRLLSEAGIFRNAFNGNALQMAFSTGNQNLGNLLWNDLNVIAPERYAQMQREYISDLKSEQVEERKTQ